VTELTHDGDEGFHEIQLSGKQLVFLFMATTVVAVLIFLCGVLVGRGVPAERSAEIVEAASATPSSTAAAVPVREPPVPTAQPTSGVVDAPAPSSAGAPAPPAADELTYRKRLEGQGNPPEDQLKASPKPEPERRVAPEPEPASAPAAAPAPAAQGARPGTWVVQLVALRDRAAATAMVQRLTSKGYPAFVVNPAAGAPNQVYKVQVGRYDDRGEAERVATRLKKEEKFNPWIQH
jgi:cell division septation protein DedD